MAHQTINAKQYPTPAGPQHPKTVYVDPNQYREPAGPRAPTAYDKIKQSVHTAKEVASDAYAAGAHARKTLHDVGQNPYVNYNAQRSGFTEPVSAVPRHATSRQQYQGAPVDENSVMHPGNRIVVLRCSDATGKCTTIATGNEVRTAPRQPRQRRPAGAVGGLGGNDPGFL
jgi:hypothetical protein